MASIAELIDSRQYTIDRNGKEAGVRVFRVLEAQNEVGAKDEFRRLTGFDKFPGASSGCILDSVNVEGKNGNTLFIVTANYSSFSGFLRREESEQAFQPFFSWGYRKVTVKLPFLYQGEITTSSGEFEITKKVWFAKTVDIVESRLIRTYKTRFQTQNMNDLDVIAEQDRKLHFINGNQYLFTGADVQQDTKDPTVYIITYTWELDKGTKAFATPKMKLYITGENSVTPAEVPALRNDIGILCGFKSLASTDQYVSSSSEAVLIRSPYTQVDVTGAESESAIPRPTGYSLYDTADEGWQQLPGIGPR